MPQSFVTAAPASSWTFLQVCFREDDEWIKDEDLEWNAIQLREAMPVYGIQDHTMVQTGPTSHTLLLDGGRNSSDLAMDYNENALHDKLKSFRDHAKKIKLVLITLPAKNTKLYAMIKRVADVRVGIHTICAVAGKQRSDGMKFWGIKHSPSFSAIFSSSTT